MPNIRLLIAILDGCSAAAFEAAHTPYLDRAAIDFGAPRRAVAPVPTVTYGNHASILTGAFPGGPSGHGVVGNLFRDPDSKAVINLDDFDLSNYVQSPTLFETLQSRIDRPVLFVTVAEPVTRGAHIIDPMTPYFRRPQLSRDDIALDFAVRTVTRHDVDLLVVNFLSVDAAGENFGPWSREYRYTIENADNNIRILREAWENSSGDPVHLIVASDHGMHAVSERVDIHRILLTNGIRSLVAASHRSAHIYLDSRMTLKRALETLDSTGKFSRVTPHHQLAAISMDHPRSGDIFVLAAPGVEFQKDGLRGSHGSDTSEETETPLIFSGPMWSGAFENNSYPKPFSLTDIANAALKLFSTENDS